MHPIRLAAALAAFALPSAVLAQAAPTINLTGDRPVLSFSVTERIDQTPDIAQIEAGVSTIAPTAQAALAQNAQQMTRVIARLKALGVADRDIQTTGISLNPQYVYPPRTEQGDSPPRVAGYQAGNNVRVRYRDLQKLGALLDTLVEVGANNINGPSFDIEEPAPLMERARDRAVVSAQAEADKYARRTGARRARLLSMTESQPIVVRADMMMMAKPQAARASTPVAPGEVSTSVTLFVQYALEP